MQQLRGLVDELFSDNKQGNSGKWGEIPASYKSWCDDACLNRFLRANSWKPDAAFAQLQETLAWRRDFQIETLLQDRPPKPLETVLRAGKLYTRGRDRAGRPIIYMKKRLENTEEIDFEMQLRLMVYTMEKAIRQMPVGVESWIWIIDLNGFSRSNATPIDVIKRMLHIFSTCYPERLFKLFLVDAPFLFHGFWSLIKPFLDSATKPKIVWVDGPATNGSKKQKAFLEWIDPDQLETTYGGSLEYSYNYEVEEKTGPGTSQPPPVLTR